MLEKSSLAILNFFASVANQSFCLRSCGLARKVEEWTAACDQAARNGRQVCRTQVRTSSGLHGRTDPGPEQTGGLAIVIQSSHEPVPP